MPKTDFMQLAMELARLHDSTSPGKIKSLFVDDALRIIDHIGTSNEWRVTWAKFPGAKEWAAFEVNGTRFGIDPNTDEVAPVTWLEERYGEAEVD